MPFFFSTTCATNCTTNVAIWESWSTSTATVSTADVWSAWGQDLTQEQCAQFQAQAQAREAQFRTQEQAARERAKEASERARELLLGYLNERQRVDLATYNWFLVDGKSGVRYRIKRGSLVGNIEVLNADGSVRHRLCAHDQREGTPLDDQLLTQKFFLEHYEQEFLSVANRH